MHKSTVQISAASGGRVLLAQGHDILPNPICISRLSCEMSTRREHPREGCLFSAMSFPEEMTLKINAFFKMIREALYDLEFHRMRVIIFEIVSI